MTEADYEKMALKINEISETNTEEEMLAALGNALHLNSQFNPNYNKFEIDNKLILENFNGLEKSRANKRMRLKPNSFEEINAEEEGRKFWQKFKDNLRTTICSDSKIKDLLEKDGSIKDYLIAAIPLIIPALGLSALSPLATTIIAYIFGLISKVGFKTYCGLQS